MRKIKSFLKNKANHKPASPADIPGRIKRYREQLIKIPNCASSLYELGRVYLSGGDNPTAISYLCQAVAADGKQAAYYCSLGVGLYRIGRQQEAICAFRQALALDAKMADAYNGLGMAQKMTGDYELATAALEKALQLEPNSILFLTNLVEILTKCHKYSQAYQFSIKAYRIDQNNLTIWTCVSESLFGLGKFSAAIHWLKQRLREKNDWDNGYHNLGRGLVAQCRFASAQKYFRRCLALTPGHVDAHFGLANALLGAGKFSEGWKEYEWRFKLFSHKNSTMGKFVSELTEPMWNGEDLAGKTLLVYSEQGAGDTIQSARFIREVVKLGCRVILLVYKPLVTLFKDLPGVSSVLAYDDLVPRYDYHVALFSLPRLLGTTVKNIPADGPYLSPIQRNDLPKVLLRKSKLKVGLFWSTPRLHAFDFRSIPVNDLEMLFEVREATFFNFQVNDPPPQLDNYKNCIKLKPHISSWQDTACFLSKMDLLLTIDSGIAHLAGSLGIPVWLIVSKSAEWRWLSPRRGGATYDKSPWYPSMKLFRSDAVGSWHGVIKRVRNEIRRRLEPVDTRRIHR